MSQENIIQFLEKYPDKWFTYKDITNQININPCSVNVSLRKLRRWNLILYKESIGIRYRRYEYQAKGRANDISSDNL